MRARTPSGVELRGAMVECCRLRGDDDEHVASLIRDSRDLRPEEIAGWIEYFKSEADRARYLVTGDQSLRGA